MASGVKGSERELLHKMPRERERMPAGLQLAQKKRAKVSYYYIPTAPRAVPCCNGWFMITHHRGLFPARQ